MTRVLQSIVFILVVLSAVAIATPVEAQSVSECQVIITDLHTTTLNAELFGQNAEKNRTGLLGKLDSAAVKLDEGKLDDSVQALIQFQARVITLSEQGKIDGGDARALVNGAGNAINCVGSLTA